MMPGILKFRGHPVRKPAALARHVPRSSLCPKTGERSSHSRCGLTGRMFVRTSSRMKSALTKIREAVDRHAKKVVRRNRSTSSLDRLADQARASIAAGDALVAVDDREDRVRAYRAAFAFCEKLAAADPGNAKWQSGLSMSHDRIGDVLLAQGNPEAALAEYCKSFTITEKLAKADRGNAERQQDLPTTKEKSGDALLAQGNAEAALAEYCKSFTITEKLAKADRGNAERQQDLSTSHEKIGDALLAQGNAEAALAEYCKSFTITEKLAKAD